MTQVVVSGGFDDLRSTHVRFLQEAARLGPVCLLLWSDEAFRRLEGRAPKFPEAERCYLLQALRYVDQVRVVGDGFSRDTLPGVPSYTPSVWAVTPVEANRAKAAFCAASGLAYAPIPSAACAGFPNETPTPPPPRAGRKKVLVTGCYDWFHSGHVRFFEEVAELGEVYVVVGHDANVRALKGEGHPLFPQEERRFLVQAIRCVVAAMISTGVGWLDAEPEILRLRPDIYAVNEDGDRPEKRAYCAHHGLEYRVLRRVPKPGLPARQSTNLRGF